MSQFLAADAAAAFVPVLGRSRGHPAAALAAHAPLMLRSALSVLSAAELDAASAPELLPRAIRLLDSVLGLVEHSQNVTLAEPGWDLGVARAVDAMAAATSGAAATAIDPPALRRVATGLGLLRGAGGEILMAGLAGVDRRVLLLSIALEAEGDRKVLLSAAARQLGDAPGAFGVVEALLHQPRSWELDSELPSAKAIAGWTKTGEGTEDAAKVLGLMKDRRDQLMKASVETQRSEL